MEVGRYNGLANTWPDMGDERRSVLTCHLALLRGLAKGLRAAMPLMAGICPLHTAFEVVFREFHPPLDPVYFLGFVGMGATFIYLPFYLTCPLERRPSMTTALLIAFGFTAGLVGVWISA